jgi:uncharacterized delta-60 repeat protein
MRTPILTILCLLLFAPCTARAACDPNIPADLSGDCHVDFNDFAIMASDWLKPAVPHEWVARYNGLGSGDDRAYAIAVDSNDNIYVIGPSFGSGTSDDYATIKYSPDSNQPVWVARYNGPANTGDWAYAVAVDGNDNIYVTGASVGSGGYSDYATIKYSPDSNQPVWVARYNGPVSINDNGSAIAVDSKDNIYVTGYSAGSTTNYDYATIKYSPDGNVPLWVARYNGPANSIFGDSPHAIAVDSNDNIYVTGQSYGSGTDFDYATIKYSPDSNQPVWVARYNGPGSGDDFAYAIAVDSSDNIYVTGRTQGSGTNNDYATIKYSPDSNQPVWVARYNGPTNGSDRARAIAIDSNDNIYVTGYSPGPGTSSDYATIKYSPDSNLPVWVARYNGPGNNHDRAYAIAVDSNDNIYVTGVSHSGYANRDDYATIKYSPDSNQPVWVVRYNGPANGSDQGRAITIDSNDNVYVTGYSDGLGADDDYATVKYSPEYTCTPQIAGDFDHNCTVDIYDLAIFCQSWLDSTAPSI